VASPIGTQQLPQEKYAEELTELDEAIVNLQVLYEKYFLGIDRRPPEQERKRVSQKTREMRTASIRNTALKFKINTLFAKRSRSSACGTAPCARSRTAPTSATSSRPSCATRIATRGVRQGRAGAGADDLRRELRRLYDTYLVAKKRCGESTAGMSFDSIASRIRAQVPELMQKHKAKNIEFKVVIKGGKASQGRPAHLSRSCRLNSSERAPARPELPSARAVPPLLRAGQGGGVMRRTGLLWWWRRRRA